MIDRMKNEEKRLLLSSSFFRRPSSFFRRPSWFRRPLPSFLVQYSIFNIQYSIFDIPFLLHPVNPVSLFCQSPAAFIGRMDARTSRIAEALSIVG